MISVAMNKLVRWTVWAPMVMASACTTVGQGYWDSKVKEMCDSDGGVRIYETVSLDRQQYGLLLNSFGKLAPPLEGHANEGVPIVRRFTSNYIKQSDPEVRRDELALVRRSDNKVLGISVTYSRVGGDLIALHPSYFSCPSHSADFFSMVVRQQ